MRIMASNHLNLFPFDPTTRESPIQCTLLPPPLPLPRSALQLSTLITHLLFSCVTAARAPVLPPEIFTQSEPYLGLKPSMLIPDARAMQSQHLNSISQVSSTLESNFPCMPRGLCATDTPHYSPTGRRISPWSYALILRDTPTTAASFLLVPRGYFPSGYGHVLNHPSALVHTSELLGLALIKKRISHVSIMPK